MPSRSPPSRRTTTTTTLATLAALSLLPAAPAPAQPPRAGDPIPPASVLNQVRIDQRLDAQIPLDLEFRDASGRAVSLRDCLDGKPAVLTLVYYGCPSLCTVTLNNLTGALRAVSLDAGDQFNILTVSFDPTETPALAAEKKESYLKQYPRPTAHAGWHFLTGDQAPIDALTDAVGFRYLYDPATGEYAHGSVVIILTPQGRVSSYLFGLEQSPKDLRLALVEASEGRIGNFVDSALLLCYQYDPITGRYGLAIMSSLQAGGALTVLAIGVFIARKLRQDRQQVRQQGRRDRAAPPPPPTGRTTP